MLSRTPHLLDRSESDCCSLPKKHFNVFFCGLPTLLSAWNLPFSPPSLHTCPFALLTPPLLSGHTAFVFGFPFSRKSGLSASPMCTAILSYYIVIIVFVLSSANYFSLTKNLTVSLLHSLGHRKRSHPYLLTERIN